MSPLPCQPFYVLLFALTWESPLFAVREGRRQQEAGFTLQPGVPAPPITQNFQAERSIYMEFIPKSSITAFANPGVSSRQLLTPDNAQSQRVTLTEVHLEPGACQPRHSHAGSEQVWYALQGSGRLLLAGGQERAFDAGDVVRFAEGDVHGLQNGGEPFVYLSVTAPPIHFGYAYQDKQPTEKRREL